MLDISVLYTESSAKNLAGTWCRTAFFLGCARGGLKLNAQTADVDLVPSYFCHALGQGGLRL